MATPQSHHKDIRSQRLGIKACNVPAEASGAECRNFSGKLKSLMATMLYTVTKNFYDAFHSVLKSFPQDFPKEPFPALLNIVFTNQKRNNGILNQWSFQISCSQWEPTR